MGATCSAVLEEGSVQTKKNYIPVHVFLKQGSHEADSVLIVGGDDSKTTLYSPANHSTTDLPQRNTLCTNSAAVSVGSQVFTIGGHGYRYDGTIPKGTKVHHSNDVEFIDVAEEVKQWRYISPMIIGRADPSAVILDEKLYVIGGIKQQKGYDKMCATEIECYTPVARSWHICGNLIVPRYEHRSVVALDKIFTFGGCNSADETLTSVECFDPLTGNTTIVAQLPIVLHNFAAVLYNNLIYIVGGGSDSERFNHKVLLFDPRSSSWVKNDMEMSAYHAQSCGLVLRGSIYCFGGSSGQQITSKIYNLDSNRWQLEQTDLAFHKWRTQQFLPV